MGKEKDGSTGMVSAAETTTGSGSAADVGALVESECSKKGKGKEVLRPIFAHPDSRIEFLFTFCRNATRIVADLGEVTSLAPSQRILDQQVTSSSPVKANLGALSPGIFLLNWSFVEAPEWESVAEITVDGTVVFRRYKARTSQGSSIPTNHGSAVIHVRA